MPRAIDLELERRWRERLREFERGSLSVREFCRAEAIQEYTFFYWRRELAKRNRLRQTARSRSKLRSDRRRRRVNGESSSRAEPSARICSRATRLRATRFRVYGISLRNVPRSDANHDR